MNYIIEDNFDFYSELNTNDKEPSINKCLISHLPLTYNSITLPCTHVFNYIPLYNDLLINNKKKDIKISCPYCRMVSNKLIPYIPLPSVNKIIGINAPAKNCMPALICSHIMTTGERKGQPCKCNGVEYEAGIFCNKHSNKDEWTEQMQEFAKTKSVVEIKALLRKAKLKVGGTKKDLVKRLVNQK